MATPVFGAQQTSGKIVRTDGQILIEGLDDFNRALGYVEKEFANTSRKASYALVRGLVLAAREKARERPIRTAAKAAKSLRGTTTKTGAYITGGGGRYPYFYGAEFGSKRYKQFESWRGNQWGGWDGGPGYFLHPAIREKGPELLEAYWAALDELTATAFPD